MKKIKSILALTLLFLVLGCGSAMAADWTIEVNGQPIDAEVKIIEGRSLIPLRAVGEALGLEVKWNGDNQAVYLSCSVKYSLQGTTQGRYLTGGVPPVRFSM